MQGLGGLAPGLNRGASMSGNRASDAGSAFPIVFTQDGYGNNGGAKITTSYSPSRSGRYQFIGWGAGAYNSGTPGGGGGALVVRTKRLAAGESVGIQIGSCYNGASNSDTVFTFPDGVSSTAGGGAYNGTTAGTASGGDINVNGTNAGAAASYGALVGGQANHQTPGGGFTGGRATVIYLGP